MNIYIKAGSVFLLSVLFCLITPAARAQCQAKIVTDSVSFSSGGNVARPDALAQEGAGSTYQLSNFSINGIKQKSVNQQLIKQLGFRKGYSFIATAAGLQSIAQQVCEVSGYHLKKLTMALDQNINGSAMLTFDFEK